MWFTPSSTARRSTPTACPRSRGTASGTRAAPVWVSRIAPKPTRLTSRSPRVQVPAAAADGAVAADGVAAADGAVAAGGVVADGGTSGSRFMPQMIGRRLQ